MSNRNRITKLAISVQCERHWTEEDIEKFAEVIIRECADHVKNSNCFTYRSQAEDEAKRLLEHFEID